MTARKVGARIAETPMNVCPAISCGRTERRAEAAASGLARYQAIVSVAGAVVFPIGIACVLLGGHDRFEPVVVAGALTVFLGMALFAVIVFRTCGQQRATPAAAEGRPRVLHYENPSRPGLRRDDLGEGSVRY